ncbi:MAG: SsrA-binding protein SmpB [Bacilli bacterium]|nr:SsrA-binding protein SmpB [Bacilli bacterium]
MEIVNRIARHEYFIEESFECGLALTGTEIKSIRNGNANIKDSYAIIRNSEVILLNMYIAQYNEGNIFNHNETRSRKLLLHKKEILKLNDKIRLEGYTLVPLKIYFKNNRAKLQLGLCKGKKNYDKRETIKERDIKRHLEKTLKSRF